ncbi:MAG: hypothetical protein GJ680_18160 [Alteromonadaceae bacterium]|nr:hypothetical protein [Alteromonadaceae bacterium]
MFTRHVKTQLMAVLAISTITFTNIAYASYNEQTLASKTVKKMECEGSTSPFVRLHDNHRSTEIVWRDRKDLVIKETGQIPGTELLAAKQCASGFRYSKKHGVCMQAGCY